MSVQRRSFLGTGIAGAAYAMGAVGCDARDTQAPQHVPDFSLYTTDGKLVSKALFAAAPVLLNFWATWCEPCRREMADLESLHRLWQAKGFQVVGVSIDKDANLVREYLMKKQITFTVLLDPLQSLSKSALNITHMPTTLLLSAEGLIRERLVGVRSWMDPSQRQAVAQKLGL